MGKYDESKNKVIDSETVSFEKSKITVGVYSYNEGENKLGISRIAIKDGEETFAKLGRMTKEEVEKVLPLIYELVKVM